MTEAGSLVTPLTGWELLADPLLNKGTAFTEAERDALGLHGLLPPHIGTLEEQVSRRLTATTRCERTRVGYGHEKRHDCHLCHEPCARRV